MKQETKDKVMSAVDWLWMLWLEHPFFRGLFIGTLVGWLFL